MFHVSLHAAHAELPIQKFCPNVTFPEMLELPQTATIKL
jgi:hypothetical protein